MLFPSLGRKRLIMAGKVDADDDLKLTTLVLGLHPKSGPAWQHRYIYGTQILARTAVCPPEGMGGMGARVRAGAHGQKLDGEVTLSRGFINDAWGSPHVLALTGLFCARTPAHRRRWLLRQGGALAETGDEMAVCSRAAEASPRNYHAWVHRLYVYRSRASPQLLQVCVCPSPSCTHRHARRSLSQRHPLMHIALCEIRQGISRPLFSVRSDVTDMPQNRQIIILLYAPLVQDELEANRQWLTAHVLDHTAIQYRITLLTDLCRCVAAAVSTA